MSYNNPNRIMYSPGSLNLATADKVWYVIGPKGKKGRLIDYGFFGVTTTFAGGTTTPTLSVGKSGSLAAYGAIYDFTTLAANTAKSIRSVYVPSDAGWATYFTAPDLPADTNICLSLVAPTGGGAAGVAVPFMIIDWDD